MSKYPRLAFQRYALAFVCVPLLATANAEVVAPGSFVAERIAVVRHEAACPPEQAAARVLAERLGLQSGAALPDSAVELEVHFAVARCGANFDALCDTHGLKLPGREKTFAEGYAVKTVAEEAIKVTEKKAGRGMIFS